MHKTRLQILKTIEEQRESKALLYVTGDRPHLETKISSEIYDYFVNHLDKIGAVDKISLILYTRGGDTLTAWSLVNLIRQFCNKLEILVPSKCHSAGTLMCLGANTIIMTKQATLGPIDPSLNSPLCPPIPNGVPGARVPVSVEAINGYLGLAKNELGIHNQLNLTQVLAKLSDFIHPLVLGEVFRSKSQIQMLARKLISYQISDEDKIKKIVGFLCSESGSHDYTIHRREARDSLGLSVEKPSRDFYNVLKSLYDDFALELEFNSKFDPATFMGASQQPVRYELKRALIESISGGSHFFVSEGELLRIHQPNPNQGPALQDKRSYEGWRYLA